MGILTFGLTKTASFLLSTAISTGIQTVKLEHQHAVAEAAKIERESNKLHGVNESLVRVVERATEIGQERGIYFNVREGLRTLETQKQYMKRGVTRTLKSKHIHGNAVDIVPVIDGKETHDWKHFYPMADLMMEAAKELNVTIRWGGAWHRDMNDFDGTSKELLEQYKHVRKMQNRGIFLDGFHFEIYKAK